MRLLLLLCFIPVFYGTGGIRVCKNQLGYLTGLNCYENNDDKRNITEVISSKGYHAEEHYLTTEDGYEILVERLNSKITKNNPVVIGHGVAMNGEGFVLQGNKSLGFVLADEGYDVWLISFRGQKYSDKGKIPNSEYRYWNFSCHEMAIYDLKETINLVWETTKKKVIYMGYSEGTRIGFVYGSLFPKEVEEKVVGIMLFAPTGYYIDSKSCIQYMIPFISLITFIDEHIFNGQIFKIIPMALKICPIGGVVTMNICHAVIGLFTGFDYGQIDWQTYPIFLNKLTDTISWKTLHHELQIRRTHRIAQFDYGEKLNMEYYNEKLPPLYNLTNIPVPVSMWVRQNDFISNVKSAKKTQSILQPKSRCKLNIIDLKCFMHLDFFQAKDVKTLFHDEMLKELKKIAQGTCSSA